MIRIGITVHRAAERYPAGHWFWCVAINGKPWCASVVEEALVGKCVGKALLSALERCA